MEVIDLREYIAIIRKRLWIILLTTIITIATSGVVSFFILEPIYQTSATLIVIKNRGIGDLLEYTDVMLSQKLVTTYEEIAKSRTVLRKVIKNLKLDMTPEELKEKVMITAVKDTEILQIQVESTDPKLATSVANNLAVVFKRYVGQLMKIDNVQIIDKAETPEDPVKPRPMLNMAIAGILGLMIGLGIVFLLEYLDNTLKTPLDIEKHLELPVIGTIPIMNEKNSK